MHFTDLYQENTHSALFNIATSSKPFVEELPEYVAVLEYTSLAFLCFAYLQTVASLVPAPCLLQGATMRNHVNSERLGNPTP